jgi:DNA replication and repair protein RecF
VYVRHLSLVDFRSWAGVDLTLNSGAVVFVGANGRGKTNLVEAIGYLATLRSHRSATDAPLVRVGAERAIVRAAVVSDSDASSREMRVEVEITPGRANRGRVNGTVLTRVREVLGVVRAVMFAPEDLAIVRGDPAERRRFLDDLIVQRSPRMAGVRADYERVLKQRGALLKSAGAARRGRDDVDLRTLDVWDAHLAAHGGQLLAARLAAVAALRPHAVAAYTQVAPASIELDIAYASSLGDRLPPGQPPADVLEATLLAELSRMRSQELARGQNLVGPHRDDVELRLGPLPVRGYASHGESWSTALALRLACYELLREEFTAGGTPILVLDDVFAELDVSRRDQLALVASKAEQVLVTAAVGSDVPDQLRGLWFDVQEGMVQRVA